MGKKTVTIDSERVLTLLQNDSENILKLIQVQMENLTIPRCPLYEEVLDTQMFALSKEINFAVRLDLIDEQTGKEMLEELEKELSILHEASMNLGEPCGGCK